MAHPFEDKLIVFIGNPTRCSRKEVRDALTAVGGVVDERITMFTHYIAAFEGAEKTKVYQKALEYDKYGQLVLLDEERFFDVLDGKAEPPEKKIPKPPDGLIITEAKDPDAIAHEYERAEQYILAKKRIRNLAKHGTVKPSGNGANVKFKSIEAAFQIAAQTKNKVMPAVQFTSDFLDVCAKCGKPASVHIGDGQGGEIGSICLYCHNELMAGLTDTEMPAHIPKQLSYQISGGKTHKFDIEFMIYATGKTLTATEIGKTKRQVDVAGELDEDFETMLETLKSRIKKSLSVKYMKPSGYFDGMKAVGYIEYNRDRQACDVIIDGKPYTWAELEKNLSAHEGWKIKIEFGDIGDVLD